MEFPLLAELLAHLCKGFAGFIGTSTGEQAIVKVFPQVSMLLEIDEHGGFLALLIHNELNTFHVLTILLMLYSAMPSVATETVSYISERRS
jgi:hypothetical protein